MKKRGVCVWLSVLMLAVALLSTGCGKKEYKDTITVFNYGMYIDPEVLDQFTEETGIKVNYEEAPTPEELYTKYKAGSIDYDLLCTSDYMLEKLIREGEFAELNMGDMENTQYIDERYWNFAKSFDPENKYTVPYFWGTFGLMYNKRKAGVEEAVLRYGWDALFNKENLPKGAKTGMYNVPRDSYAACMFHHDLSPNLVGSEYLELVKKDLKNANFDQWGTDELKKQVQKGDLDVAFMYTGDFLDMYYQEESEEVPYDIYIPNNTIAFMDSFVLTKNARHVDLAYEFMNYFLDVDNAMANASVVGYCTPLQESYNKIVSLKDSSYQGEKNWAQAMEKYYPLPKEDWPKPYQGTPLTNFDKDYLTKVTNLVNDVKTN